MEILVLGDGGYVFAVLNAVSGMTSYGKLGALGAMLGLLLMGVKGMAAPGGPKLDPAPILISICLFWVMFIPRVDRVIVAEMMAQPGDVAPRTFVVDNVPLGLAAAGYLVSNIGAKLTMQFETSFGSANDSVRGTTGGLGKNLSALTMLRSFIADPNFSDPSRPGHASYIARMRANFTDFMAECAFPLVNNGVMDRSTLTNSAGISGVVNEISGNEAKSVQTQRPDGTFANINCKELKDHLLHDSSSPELLDAFDRAVAATGRKGNVQDIKEAFATYTNEAATNMQSAIATSIMMSVMSEAAVRGSLSPADAQGIIMVEEAAARRNVQWAAEESLFIRILRPVVGFFEGLFFALAPIMAMVVAMGPFGWNLAGKYMMLTIWVGLWFPMLAITQLYSNVQMQYFFDLLKPVQGVNDAVEFAYSPMQLNMIANQAMDALGTASALTAATPALAMSLLYGGAVSMSYLAGRLQGSDMVDETKVAPQASAVAPIAQMGSAQQSTDRGGHTNTGAPDVTYNKGSAVSNGTSLSDTAQVQASQNWNTAITNSNGEKIAFGVGGSTTDSHVSGSALKETFGRTLSSGVAKSTLDSDQAQLLSKVSEGITVSGGAGTPPAFVISADMRKQLAGTDELAKTEAAVAALNKSVSGDSRLGSDFAVAAARDTREAIDSNAMHGFSHDRVSQLGKAASDVISSSKAVQNTQALASTAGTSQSVNLPAAATHFSGQEVGSYKDRLEEMGLGGKDLAHSIDTMKATSAGSPKAQELGGIIDQLQNGQGKPGTEAARAEMYSEIMGRVFAGGGALPTYDHAAAAAVTSQTAGVHHGEARGAVERDLVDPSKGAGEIAATTAGRLGGVQQAVNEGGYAINGAETTTDARNFGIGDAPGGVTKETLNSAGNRAAASVDESFGNNVDKLMETDRVGTIARGMHEVNGIGGDDIAPLTQLANPVTAGVGAYKIAERLMGDSDGGKKD